MNYTINNVVLFLKKKILGVYDFVKYQNKPPFLESFSADLKDVAVGTVVTLSWKGKRVGKLFLNGQLISTSKKAISVQPQKDTKYILSAENPFGKAILRESVIVGYPPIVDYFKTDEEIPFYIEGQLVQFTWKIANAKEISLMCKSVSNPQESIDMAGKKKYYKTFTQDTEVHVKTENKYGITESKKIRLRIAPLPKYDVKVPFPAIMLTQVIPEAMPKFDFSIKESELIAPFPKEILNLSELKFNL